MISQYNVSRPIALIFSIIGSASLSGCASTVPAFDVPYLSTEKEGAVPTVHTIATRIECELASIANGSPLDQLIIKKGNVVALVELSLTVTDDGALAPTAMATNGVFSYGTGVKFDQSRAQNFTENLMFSMPNLQRNDATRGCDFPPDTNLAGNLGLKQMWQLADSSGPNAEWNKTGDTGAFGGSITFTVDKELTATGPTWKLTHFTGPGSFLSAYDKNVDKLTIGFARGKKAESTAQDVINKVKQNQQTDALQTIANSQK